MNMIETTFNFILGIISSYIHSEINKKKEYSIFRQKRFDEFHSEYLKKIKPKLEGKLNEDDKNISKDFFELEKRDFNDKIEQIIQKQISLDEFSSEICRKKFFNIQELKPLVKTYYEKLGQDILYLEDKPDFFRNLSSAQSEIIKSFIDNSINQFRRENHNEHEKIYKLLASQLALPKKVIYDKPNNYIHRLIFPFQENKETYYQLDGHNTFNILFEKKHILLIGDAGEGKTEELKKFAYDTSKSESDFYPYLILLKLYGRDCIKTMLDDKSDKKWRNIPKDKIILIIDGLDEVQEKDFLDCIKEIKSIIDDYPEIKIILSCRRNFYQEGLLENFTAYQLRGITFDQINTFISNHLSTDSANNIFKHLKTMNLENLLKIPFYLVNIVKLYKEENKLPDTKIKLLNLFIEKKISFDREHFKTKIVLKGHSDIIENALQRLSFGLLLMGKDTLEDLELKKIIIDENTRNILLHSTLWCKLERYENDEYYFEHKNFQEFLAAKFLSKQDLNFIKSHFSVNSDRTKVKPHWINTLSFLVSLYNNIELILWIIEIAPELTVQFEKDKIELSNRIKIFEQIFNTYKEKEIVIPYEKFNFSQLALFGQSEEIIGFLIEEIKKPAHIASINSAMKLISNMDILFNKDNELKNVLTDTAKNNTLPDYTRGYAISAISDLDLLDENTLSEFINLFQSESSSSIRSALYRVLENSNVLDNHVDFLLEGLKYLTKIKLYDNHVEAVQNLRMGDEGYYLIKGLQKINSPEGIKKILDYLAIHPNSINNEYYLQKAFPDIIAHAVNACKADNSILENVFQLFVTFHKFYVAIDYGILRDFFHQTGTAFQIFQRLYKERNISSNDVVLFSTLADTKCVDFIIDEYNNGKLRKDDLFGFINLIHWKNSEMYLSAVDLVNRNTDIKIELPKTVKEFTEEEKIIHDIELIFNPAKLFEEVYQIFELLKKDELTMNEMYNFAYDFREIKPYTSYIFENFIRSLFGEEIEGSLNQKTIKEKTDKIVWDYYAVDNLYHYSLKDPEKIFSYLDKEQKERIINWCKDKLYKFDFKNALKFKEDNRFTINNYANYVSYYFRNLDDSFITDKRILKDKLQFDSIDGHNWVGIKYLEKYLDQQEMTDTILTDLVTGELNEQALQNHLDYCIRKTIKNDIIFRRALETLVKDFDGLELKRKAMNVYFALEDKLDELVDIIPEMPDSKENKDYIKWELIDGLSKKRNEKCKDYLLELLKSSSSDDKTKLKAAKYLFRYQNLEALQYYFNWIKKNHKIPEDIFYREKHFENYTNMDAFQVLLDIISYIQTNIPHDPYKGEIFNSTVNALGEIFANNPEDALKMIRNAMDKQSELSFLYYYLDKWEEEALKTKIKKPTLEEIIKILDEVCPL